MTHAQVRAHETTKVYKFIKKSIREALLYITALVTVKRLVFNDRVILEA